MLRGKALWRKNFDAPGASAKRTDQLKAIAATFCPAVMLVIPRRLALCSVSMLLVDFDDFVPGSPCGGLNGMEIALPTSAVDLALRAMTVGRPHPAPTPSRRLMQMVAVAVDVLAAVDSGPPRPFWCGRPSFYGGVLGSRSDRASGGKPSPASSRLVERCGL